MYERVLFFIALCTSKVIHKSHKQHNEIKKKHFGLLFKDAQAKEGKTEKRVDLEKEPRQSLTCPNQDFLNAAIWLALFGQFPETLDQTYQEAFEQGSFSLPFSQ